MYYFDEYVMSYDINDPDINYKYHHSYRVMGNMVLLANALNLSSKDTYLAKVIGLLHDIGRFEQDKLYNSFVDNRMDHGSYGVMFLKRTNFLDKFNISLDDYCVVYNAILNHNKFSIQGSLTERELLFTKMIRDADKLDILYAYSSPYLKPKLRENDDEISSNVRNVFFNNQPLLIGDLVTVNDSLILIFCFIFDINFKESYELIYRKDFYNKIYDRITNKEIFNEYIKYVNDFLRDRINI